MEYVAGFMFNHDQSRVVLIRKKRPQYQAGMLNAVGGKIETGETPHQAMSREFFEETGVSIPENKWRIAIRLHTSDATIEFFIANGETNRVRTTTDEEVVVVNSIIAFYRDDLLPTTRMALAICMSLYDRLELPIELKHGEKHGKPEPSHPPRAPDPRP